jgi:hypothetical protein
LNYELAKAHRVLAIFYVALFLVACVYVWRPNLSEFWVIVGALAIAFSLIITLHFAASRGVEHSKWWARVISVLLGTVLLIGFPIGTAIGGYLLYLSLGAWEKPESSAA